MKLTSSELGQSTFLGKDPTLSLQFIGQNYILFNQADAIDLDFLDMFYQIVVLGSCVRTSF